jgi:hypothetical protein
MNGLKKDSIIKEDNSVKFYFPPHPGPKNKIRYVDLPLYDKLNRFVAQRKYNGSHAVIHYPSMQIWDRRGKPLFSYKMSESMKECFHSLNLKKEYVFDGEVLHTKAKSKITGKQSATNTIVLFDLLFAGRYLSGVPFIDRMNLLDEVCKHPRQLEEKNRALLVDNAGVSNLWLAETFNSDFLNKFYEFFDYHAKTGEDKFPEIEGLILKNKAGMLLSGGKLEDNDWIVRVRKEKPNMYSF